jgi:hypothetical protein
MNLVLKYPVFIKTSKNTKKIEKRKNYFCAYGKKCFSIHFGFNNQFIKVKRTLAKISKTTKILFCLSFSIQGMTLHVIRIPDIKKFFQTLEHLGSTPLR